MPHFPSNNPLRAASVISVLAMILTAALASPSALADARQVAQADVHTVSQIGERA